MYIFSHLNTDTTTNLTHKHCVEFRVLQYKTAGQSGRHLLSLCFWWTLSACHVAPLPSGREQRRAADREILSEEVTRLSQSTQQSTFLDLVRMCRQRTGASGG